MKFTVLPVLDLPGVTRDLEQLQALTTEYESKISTLETKVNTLTGAWTNPESFSTKLIEHTTVQVRTEQSKTSARLKGLAKTSEEIAGGTAIFTLPVGFRPPAEVILGFQDNSAKAYEVLRIKTSGVVEPQGAMTTAHFFSFDGITFQLT